MRAKAAPAGSLGVSITRLRLSDGVGGMVMVLEVMVLVVMVVMVWVVTVLVVPWC